MIAVAAAAIIATTSPVAVDHGPLPLSLLHQVFEDQPPPKQKAKLKVSTVMIGFVPKSEFIQFMRSHIYDAEVKYSKNQIKSNIISRRNIVLNMSQRTVGKGENDEFDGPALRSGMRDERHGST